MSEREITDRQEMGRRGGRRSGESRRKKREFREVAGEMIRTVVSNPELIESLKSQGISKEKMTYQEAMVAGMIIKAIGGDPRAYKAIKDTVEPERERLIDVALDNIDRMLFEVDREADGTVADGVDADGGETQ